MASLSARIFIRATNRELEVPTGLFINNQFVPSVDSTSEPILYVTSFDNVRNSIVGSAINPATEETICTVVAGNYVATGRTTTMVEP